MSAALFALLAFDIAGHPDSASVIADVPQWFLVYSGLVLAPLTVLLGTVILPRTTARIIGRFLILYELGFTGWQFSYHFGSPVLDSLSFSLFCF